MPERHLAFAAQRDEGPFLVEWIAWQRMLGFEVLVAHNDCTDHSPQLLAAFADAGWIATLEHRPTADLRPKASAHLAARAHPLVARADWMLVCDVDELMLPKLGGGTVAGLLDALGRDALGYAVHWQCFGSGGWRRWRDGPAHRQFRRVGKAQRAANGFYKTIFRDPLGWQRFTDHEPVGWTGPGGPAAAAEGLLDGERRPLPRLATEAPPARYTAPEGVTHRNAQVNHYVVRSLESYGLKRGTPSATAGRDRYTDDFLRHHDRNGMRDLSALAFAAAFDPVHAAAMALPGVERLHHLCCADYAARLAAKAGTRPEDDARWRHHREAAGA